MKYLKAFVFTVSGTFSFLFLDSVLTDEYVPCTSAPCTVLKLSGDEVVPSTLSSVFKNPLSMGKWKNPFKIVQNGDDVVQDAGPDFLPPRCPGTSGTEMQRLCATRETMKQIFNPMSQGFSRAIYTGSISGWFLCKLIHDWLLMLGLVEVVTLQIGLLSVCFQLIAVAVCFIWSMAAAEVFVAPLQDGACGCYYRLPTLQTAIILGTPLGLYKIAILKLEAVVRSLTAGDYLYFMSYDLPYYFVAASLADPTNSMLVHQIRGAQVASTYEHMYQVRPLFQMRRLLRFTEVLLKLRTAVAICVSFSLGPFFVRMVEIAIKHCSGAPFLSLAFQAALWALLLIVGVVAFYAIVWLNLMTKLWCPCWGLTIHDLNTSGYDVTPQSLGISSLRVLGLTIAGFILANPLCCIVFGSTFEPDAKSALKWAFAGRFWYYLGVETKIKSMFQTATMECLYVSSRSAKVGPHAYMRIAQQHPELRLHADAEGAASLLSRYGDKPHGITEERKWMRQWERFLGDEVSDEDSDEDSDQT